MMPIRKLLALLLVSFALVYPLMVVSAGEPVTPARVAESTLVINEIDYDQPGYDTAEFIELKNHSATAITLTGYSVQIVNGDNITDIDEITIPDGTVIAPGCYYVICNQAKDNVVQVPNCNQVEESGKLGMIQNGAPDAVALIQGGEIVDTVSYEGDTGAPYTEGSGVGLADTDDPNTGISRFSDGKDTDQNNADFSLRCITPGATNSAEDTACEDPTLVTLINFKAEAVEEGVLITWETSAEIDNAGFNLYRAATEAGPYRKLNDALIPAEGDPLSGAIYRYPDETSVSEDIFYKLEDIDLYGVSTFHGPVSIADAVTGEPINKIRLYLPIILANPSQ